MPSSIYISFHILGSPFDISPDPLPLLGEHSLNMDSSDWNSPSCLAMLQQFSTLPPEVQRIVFTFVDHNTLASCIHVCKSWKAVITLLFRRTFDIKDEKFFTRLSSKEFRQVLFRNAPLIRALHVHHMSFLSALVPY